MDGRSSTDVPAFLPISDSSFDGGLTGSDAFTSVNQGHSTE
jgi:hypothetical protein